MLPKVSPKSAIVLFDAQNSLEKSRKSFFHTKLLSSADRWSLLVHQDNASTTESPTVEWVDTGTPPTVQKAYTIEYFRLFAELIMRSLRSSPLCESGGTGRRARLRISWATVGVQVPPLAPVC